jgi:uncharacterized protein YndB with AHSA1/START domain
MVESNWQGEVLKSERPRLLSYTFQMQISDTHRSERPSRVTFELQSMGAVVKLTLTHETFASASATFESTRHGWPAISSLEIDIPLPFQGLGFGPSSEMVGRL